MTESSRTLHKYNVYRVASEAYDETGSKSADRVSVEIFYDACGLARIPFAPGDQVSSSTGATSRASVNVLVTTPSGAGMVAAGLHPSAED